MINGTYPSQLPELQAMRSSHYKRLQKIINKSTQQISYMPSEFGKMIMRKKSNHEKWKSFHLNQLQSCRYKRNAGIYEKLKCISNTKSRYSIKTEPCIPKDPLLHHNYLYQCQRRFVDIEKTNELIASRIISTKGEIDSKKQQADYKFNKLNVSRLQKFERIKRLSRVVEKNITRKFSTTTSKIQKIQKIGTSRSKTFNPQTV